MRAREMLISSPVTAYFFSFTSEIFSVRPRYARSIARARNFYRCGRDISRVIGSSRPILHMRDIAKIPCRKVGARAAASVYANYPKRAAISSGGGNGRCNFRKRRRSPSDNRRALFVDSDRCCPFIYLTALSRAGRASNAIGPRDKRRAIIRPGPRSNRQGE